MFTCKPPAHNTHNNAAHAKSLETSLNSLAHRQVTFAIYNIMSIVARYLTVSFCFLLFVQGCKETATQPPPSQEDTPVLFDFHASISPTTIASNRNDNYQLWLRYAGGRTDYHVFEGVDQDSMCRIEFKFSADSLLNVVVRPPASPYSYIELNAQKLAWGTWMKHCTFWTE